MPEVGVSAGRRARHVVSALWRLAGVTTPILTASPVSRTHAGDPRPAWWSSPTVRRRPPGSALLIRICDEWAQRGWLAVRYTCPIDPAPPEGPPSGSAAADRAGVLEAIEVVRGLADGPVIAGGHSYGGRQTSMVVAEHPGLVDVLTLFSYPLHPPGKPDRLRTEHFAAITAPTVFTQGTADPFGTIEELRTAVELIAAPTEIVEITGARHDLGSKTWTSQDGRRRGDSDADLLPVPSKHGRASVRRNHRRGRIRWNRGGDPASSGWVSTISCFSARGRPGRNVVRQPLPGLAVDVPTTSYSLLLFEPNPNWSRLFSTGTEIKVRRRRRRQVRRAPPHPVQHNGRGRQVGRGRQHVAGRAGRRRDAHRAISDHRHRLPVPAADPGDPGITGFEGTIIHTADWDDSYDPTNRRIGIIGTGATAVQLIPELARAAADLTVYQRTPIWVVPKVDVPFSARAKRLFARMPLAQRAIRVVTDALYEFMVYVAVVHRRTFRGRFNIAASDLAKMYRFVTIRDKDLRRRLTPTTTSGASGRRSPTATTSRSTSPRCTCGTAASTGSNRTASSPTTAPRPSSTPSCWQRIRSVGGQLPGHRGRRPRRPQPRKVVAETRFQAYQGVAVPYFPTSSAWPALRLHRPELLQHDGVPDAAHGSAVR